MTCDDSVAILGGPPAFDDWLHVGRPNMPDRQVFMRRMDEVWDSGRLTNLGPMSCEFERRVAEISGRKHCIATCNATVGLELAIDALGMRGDVIVPSFTFIATVHALWRQGIRPVFCDIDPKTHCLDVNAVRGAITSRTTGILGVSLWGNTSAGQELFALARERGLKLLFDSAHAFACGDAGIPAMNDAEVFSFHATKCIQAFEGGAIITDDDDLARRLRLMINFGFDGEDRVEHLGTNGKMSEPAAAMGLTSLEALDRIIGHNRWNFEAYIDGIEGIPGLSLMRYNTNQRHNFQYVVTELDEERAGLTRDELVAALRLENVMARRYFCPGAHRMRPYAQLFPQAGLSLPVTEAVSKRVMILPTGMSISTADVTRLTSRIASILARGPQVRAALKECRDDRLPEFFGGKGSF